MPLTKKENNTKSIKPSFLGLNKMYSNNVSSVGRNDVNELITQRLSDIHVSMN